MRAVLEPFEVCWSDGVEYPSGQGNEATVMSDVGKAIKSNRNSATAHNDLLIPVRCKATGKLEFIAAQCRYGEKKDAGGLKLQDKAKKDNFEDCKMCCCRFELSLKAGRPLQTRHGPGQTSRGEEILSNELRDYHCAAGRAETFVSVQKSR